MVSNAILRSTGCEIGFSHERTLVSKDHRWEGKARARGRCVGWGGGECQQVQLLPPTGGKFLRECDHGDGAAVAALESNSSVGVQVRRGTECGKQRCTLEHLRKRLRSGLADLAQVNQQLARSCSPANTHKSHSIVDAAAHTVLALSRSRSHPINLAKHAPLGARIGLPSLTASSSSPASFHDLSPLECESRC